MVAISLSALTLVASAGSGNGLVPVPSVSVDRDHITLQGGADDTLTATFAVRNHADCGVVLTKQRATVVGITVDCPRWTLVANDSMTCDLTARRARKVNPYHVIDRFLLTATVAEDCKVGPLAFVDARKRKELQPLEDEYAQHSKSAPSELDLNTKLRLLVTTKDAAAKVLEGDEAKAKTDAQAERQMLADSWKKVEQELIKRVETLRLKIEMLPKDDSLTKMLDEKIAKTKQTMRTEVEALDLKRTTVCNSVGPLRSRMFEEIAELRDGAWHDKCNRTASQIKRETGQELDVHLREEGGKMIAAPDDVIRAREEAFETQIKAAESQCSSLRIQVANTKQKWADEVMGLVAKRPEIERIKKDMLEKARQELTMYDENSRAAVMKQRARFDQVDRTLKARTEELKAKREQLENQLVVDQKKLRTDHDKAVLDHQAKGRALFNKAANLRNELLVLTSNISNAHHKSVTLGVQIDVTFVP